MTKIALVTGAVGGIGRAVAVRLAETGFAVAVHCHTEERLDVANEVAVECRDNGASDVCIVVGDLSSKEGCFEVVSKVEKQMGLPDVLVNSVGIVRFGPVEKFSEECFKEVMACNFDSAFFLTQAVVSSMKRKRYGKIINITSYSSKTGSTGISVYTAAKAAVEALSRSMAIELGAYGITVNCVSPGYVMTSWAEQLTPATREAEASRIPLGRFASPKDISNAVAFLASDDASYITGKIIEVTGGL